MIATKSRRRPLALIIVVLTIAVGLTATQAAAPAADVGSGKTGVGFHISSAQNDQAAPFLENPANFGPNGVVRGERLNIVPDKATIRNAYLARIDVLFDGWAWTDDWTTAEVNRVDAWVRAGGVLISTNDDGANPQPHAGAADRLASHFGAPVAGSQIDTPDTATNMFPTARVQTHPIVNGPFGRVNQLVANGTTGHFGPNPGGFNVLFRDPNGNAVVIERAVGDGHVILVGDEGFFHRFGDQSPNPSGDNQAFTGNVFAYAVALTGENTGLRMCLGKPVTIFAQRGVVTHGTSTADVVWGTPGADTIRTFRGNDRVCARGGADTVVTGAGADRIDLGPGHDVGNGGAGADLIFGRKGRDRLLGKNGADNLVGGPGNDRLNGGNGGDTCNGGGGNNSLISC